MHLGLEPSGQGQLFRGWAVPCTAVDIDEVSLTLKTRGTHRVSGHPDLERYRIGIVVCDV